MLCITHIARVGRVTCGRGGDGVVSFGLSRGREARWRKENHGEWTGTRIDTAIKFVSY